MKLDHCTKQILKLPGGQAGNLELIFKSLTPNLVYSEQSIETTSEKHNCARCQSLLCFEKSKHSDIRRNEA